MSGKIGKPGDKQISGVRVKSFPEVFVEPPPKPGPPGTCIIATNTEMHHEEISKLQHDSSELNDLTNIHMTKTTESGQKNKWPRCDLFTTLSWSTIKTAKKLAGGFYVRQIQK